MKFTKLEQELIRALALMVGQHCFDHKAEDKTIYWSGFLSANKEAFRLLSELGIMELNNGCDLAAKFKVNWGEIYFDDEGKLEGEFIEGYGE